MLLEAPQKNVILSGVDADLQIHDELKSSEYVEAERNTPESEQWNPKCQQ